jgi:orotidine-5'-phosphate decarboxylase
MPGHFADRLLAAIADKGSPVCVGLDPRFDRLPEQLQTADPIEAIGAFSRDLLEVVAPFVPAVKPQIAYFEVYRDAGMKLYFELVELAQQLGLLVIGDVKRGDIGSTAEAYAAGHLADAGSPDAVTVNAYFGVDGLAPFVNAARDGGGGLFALVRTSNPSAADIQDVTDAAGKPFYEHMAEQIAALGSGEGLVGECGYSCVGAVVGATYPDEARRLRELMPQQIFLVPGYGAQGATAADCAASFKSDGSGAIVNASRSVIYAHQRDEYAGIDWKQAVAAAAKAFAEDIRTAVR